MWPRPPRADLEEYVAARWRGSWGESLTARSHFEKPARELSSSISVSAFHHLGSAIQCRREKCNLLSGTREIVFVDSFVNSRDHHGRISGVLARSIDGVSKPRTIRQSLGNEQRSLRIAQSLIQLGGVVWRILLPHENPRRGLLEVMRRLSSLSKVHLLTSELSLRFLFRGVDVRGYFLGIIFIVVWQDVGVGHADDRNPEDARHLLLVNEIRISEFLEP